MHYHLVTLGCQMNQSDSGRVRKELERLGYSSTDSEEEADIIGILACSVRQKAIDKVYSKIVKWNKRKKESNLLTFVSGCILPDDNQKFLKLFDLVFGMSELPQLEEMIAQYGITTGASSKLGFEEKKPVIDSFWKLPQSYQSTFEAFVPIQNGCDKFCSFCAVPYTRGREVSRPSEQIIQEVENLVDKGYKSITLLGQNVNSYGLDKKGNELSFSQLLDCVGQIGLKSDKEFWVYYTSPHPRDMTDDVLDVMAKYPVIANQIHLPLQSGDNKVLIKMNRKHSLAHYRSIVKSIRKKLPDATLYTDIIVGFTGEDEMGFQSTMDAFDEFRFNMAYIAMYSRRPGAAAYSWPEDVDIATKKDRLAKLNSKLSEISQEYNNNLIGETLRLLVKGKDRKDGFLTGQTEGKLVTRFKSDNSKLIGQFVDVEITSATPFSIEGELLPNILNVVLI